MRSLLCLIALTWALSPCLEAAVFSPGDFGAVFNGTANDGASLQRAIDAANAAGGGTVILPSGRTLMAGSIELKSNVVLDLEPGSRLVSSTLQSDFPDSIFIKARHAQNVSITGSGTIDGRGLEFLGKEGPYIYEKKAWRPRLILLEDCRHVSVSGVNLKDAAFWSLHLAGCEDVSIHGISIRNSLKAPNCDGIDPDHSRDVRITDCSVECGDDAIVVKNSREFAQYGPCENIVVSGCVITTRDCALKIGSETVDLIRNVIFSDCIVNECGRGIGIMVRDEGDVEDIVAHDIVIRSRLFFPTPNGWWGASEAIYVNVHPRTPGARVGQVRSLRFSHIVARGEAGVFIRGCAQSVPDDIVLDNVTLDIAKVSEWPSRFDLRPPEELGVQDRAVVIAGIDLQDASHVTLRDCAVRWGPNSPASYGPRLRTERVAGIQVENLQGSDAHPH